MSVMHAAHYFEELGIGQKWTSPRRTVTESDIVIFAGMTGDYDRAHVDHDYASKSRFKQPLMHGMMGMAWVAGLSTTAPSVKTLALVSVEEWKFLRPVHIGDTVHVVTEVVELATGGRSAGKVTWKKSLINQRGEEVQSGLFVSLVELAPRIRKPSSGSSGPHFLPPSDTRAAGDLPPPVTLPNAPEGLATGQSRPLPTGEPPTGPEASAAHDSNALGPQPTV